MQRVLITFKNKTLIMNDSVQYDQKKVYPILRGYNFSTN